MPNIRDMKPQEFQNLLGLNDEELNERYNSMSCGEQQDFILRVMKESHPVLRSLNISLDEMKTIVVDIQLGTQNLWNGVRTYLTASDIRKNAGQISMALFGDYIMNVAYLNQLPTDGSQPLPDAGAVDSAYQNTEELVARAKRAEQLNFIQVTDDPPIFHENEPMGFENMTVPQGNTILEQGQNNPSVPMENPDDDMIRDMFAYEIQTDPNTGLVLHGGVPQPIGPHLTNEIISTGNRKVLEQFYQDHKKELNKKEERYMRRRIRAAKHFEKLEKSALMHAAYGEKEKVPNDMEIGEDEDGFIGFKDLRLIEPQSSNNGCWSCSYSLLLKSRGVNLTQEEIRSFRVDLGENTKEQIKVTQDYRTRMNLDTVNNLYENGDLLMKVLPNTALTQFTLDPMVDTPLTIQTLNKPPEQLNSAQAAIFEQYYVAQTKEKLQSLITNALTVEKSPIAINYSGHYMTITGISPDGRIRVEDSARSYENNPTRILNLTDIIEESLYGKKGYDKVAATGLSLTWLKDIPTPEYGKVSPENNQIGNHPGTVRMDQDGVVLYDIKGNDQLSMTGSAQTGQGAGNNLSETMLMDLKDTQSLLGGKVEGFGGVNGKLMIGSMDTYYPKKVYLPGDPKLEPYKYNPEDEVVGTLRGLMDSSLYTLHFDQNIGIEPMFRKYIHALDELHFEHEPEEVEQIEDAKNTLRELHDLFRQPYRDGRTYFQVLQEGLKPENRERFKNLWNKLDKSANLGLNLDEIQFIPEPVRRYEQGLPAMDVEPTKPFAKELYLHWKSIEGKMGDPEYHRNEIEEQLSMIIATEEKWTEAIENAQFHGNVKVEYQKEIIKESAKKIRESRAFVKLMEKDNFIKLAKSGSSVDLVNAYRDAEKLMGDREKSTYFNYAGAKQGFDAQKVRISEVYRELRNTRTGTYLGWGIISRKHNSAKFEKAFKALETIKNSSNKPSDAKARYLACLDIMDYLEGKEKLPNRTFGKKRWEGFMKTLAEVMPRDEFEKYCQHINEVRGVKNKPESSNYIGPENFYKKGASIDDMLKDSRERINNGRATERDYARSMILETLKQEGRTLVTRTELRKLTDRTLRNKEFQMVMMEHTPQAPSAGDSSQQPQSSGNHTNKDSKKGIQHRFG